MNGESSNPELQELNDEEFEQLGKEYEARMGGFSNLDEPYREQKDSWLILMRDFKKTNDSIKISNLDHQDLIRTRANIRLSLFCDALLPKGKLKKWFDARAEALCSTSMGKNGKFLDTTVTQIKKQGVIAPRTVKKKTLFGGVKEVPVSEG